MDIDEIVSEIKSSVKLNDKHTALVAFGYDDKPLGWRSVRITPDGYSYVDMLNLVMEHPCLRYCRSIEDILSIKNSSMVKELEDYKIIDDGIWIPKSELERLVKEYDNAYTNIYLQSLKDDTMPEFSALEKAKYRSIYNFIKENLLNKLNNKQSN